LALDLFTKIKEKDGVRAPAGTPDEIFELAIERRKVRENKNFEESDRLRNEIEKGVIWSRTLTTIR